jgi:hypothetical protein
VAAAAPLPGQLIAGSPCGVYHDNQAGTSLSRLCRAHFITLPAVTAAWPGRLGPCVIEKVIGSGCLVGGAKVQVATFRLAISACLQFEMLPSEHMFAARAGLRQSGKRGVPRVLHRSVAG